MKKIVDFFIGQLISFFMFACLIGFFYIIYGYSNNVETSDLYYNKMMIGNYQLDINLDLGTQKLDNVLILELKDIIDNRVYYKADSTGDIIMLFSAILLIVLDIIVFVTDIIYGIFSLIKKANFERILKEKYDVSDNVLYKLPNYEPILAYTILSKKYQYERLVYRLKYYYRSKGILNKFDKLKKDVDFDKNNLTELEQYVFDSNISEITEPIKSLFRSHQSDVLAQTRVFRGMLKKELVKKGFYSENDVQIKINKLIEKVKAMKGKKLTNEDIKYILKIVGITLAMFVLMCNFEIVFWLIIISFIWLSSQYYKVHLSLEGEIERAKINFLVNHLKNKKELSEKEKYFFIMLTK